MFLKGVVFESCDLIKYEIILKDCRLIRHLNVFKMRNEINKAIEEEK